MRQVARSPGASWAPPRLSPWLTAIIAGSSLSWAACGPAGRQQHIVAPPMTTEVSEGLATAVGAAACPMGVEGTDVQVVPLARGVALVFTTPLESPLPLRRRVERFAASYDSVAASGFHDSAAGFPTRAVYSEVAAGARVEILPISAARLQDLRAHLRQRAAHMQVTQSC